MNSPAAGRGIINYQLEFMPFRLIRIMTYKYTEYLTNVNALLYDLVRDRHESKNFVKDQAYRDIIQSLKTDLFAWRKETNDSILTGPLDYPPLKKPDKYSEHSPTGYLIKD
jgi:hypothetical protein